MKKEHKATKERQVTGYRALLLLLGLLGVAMQIREDGIGMLMYYTILSNLLVSAWLIYLLIRKNPSDSLTYRIQGGVTMSIMITFAVYHFLLSPTVELEKFYTIDNFLCHYLVPIGFFFDTLYLGKGKYQRYDPIRWTAVPLLYSIFALVNGLVFKIPIPSPDSPFPYFFVNVTKYGWANVLRYASGILIAYVLLGYLFYYIKNRSNDKAQASKKIQS